jgi:hypothetical protein
MPEETAVARTPQQVKFLAEHRRAFRKASDEWARAQGCTHRITETGSMQPLGSPPSNGAVGRAPREATNDRQRGSRRGARASSSSSDDPDDEGPTDEPPARRLCQFCGGDIPAERARQARYCSDRHADRDRQRRKRQRDRERDLRPRMPTSADFRRMLEITDELSEQLRLRAFCNCNGRHQEFEPGECFRCGHWLPRRGVVA